MIAAMQSVDHVRRQWQTQILANRGPASVAARRAFVSLTLTDQSNAPSVFVNIEQLLVVLLYEDKYRTFDELRPKRLPLRLVGYRVGLAPHGVRWGGADNAKLFKDLMLTPRYGARGQRLDCSKGELLSLALTLDSRLSRAARHPGAPWPALRLPRLWAGFRSRHVGVLRGEGPEFEQACRRRRVNASDLFQGSAQQMDSSTLYPLDWVSGQLDRATGVFAEMTPGLRRQVFRLDEFPDGLRGFQGASEFDFYNSRFRRMPCSIEAVNRSEKSNGELRPKCTPVLTTASAGTVTAAQCAGCVS